MNILPILFFAVTIPAATCFGWQNAAENSPIEKKPKMQYAIAIHGGAGSSPTRFSKEANGRRAAAMRTALQMGTDILKAGGSALEATEKVVLFLEDDPQFNSGVGAVFNADGSHELDAAIMDGRNKACGAVAGVSHVKNPITLARLVMTDTEHVLLSGRGAEIFAQSKGLPMVEPSYFDTEATLKAWQRARANVGDRSALEVKGNEALELVDLDTGSYQGTVGCVALDSKGNLAAATSTGGLTNKKFGRIGDSPIVGAGTYADNETCAISGTGIGEQYIRNVVAYNVAAQMKYRGVSLQAAIDDNLQNRLKPGDGGIIGVDREGNIYMAFNTQGMARAAANSEGRFEVLWDEPSGQK
jgi:beta-aspartyl-peptidase (threonine type)